ncbi:hypothetical protein ACNPNP_18170 [Microbacterium sp. AGC85]
MSAANEQRFELRRVTDDEWVILDHRYRTNDPRRPVASVFALSDTEVEVTWLRDLPMSSSYQSPFDVLEDLRRLYRKNRSRRPILIPHMPPRATPASA